MEAVYLALIVAAGALLTNWLTARQIRKGKEQDYARQDAVAAQAAVAAELLKEDAEALAKQAREAAHLLSERQDETERRTAETARLLLAANERVANQSAEADRATYAKLDAIKGVTDAVHLLVNSNLTRALQAELASHKALLASLREVADMRAAAGLTQTEESTDAVTVTRGRITELSATIEDRLRQTEVADSEIEEADPGSRF